MVQDAAVRGVVRAGVCPGPRGGWGWTASSAGSGRPDRRIHATRVQPQPRMNVRECGCLGLGCCPYPVLLAPATLPPPPPGGGSQGQLGMAEVRAGNLSKGFGQLEVFLGGGSVTPRGHRWMCFQSCGKLVWACEKIAPPPPQCVLCIDAFLAVLDLTSVVRVVCQRLFSVENVALHRCRPSTI